MKFNYKHECFGKKGACLYFAFLQPHKNNLEENQWQNIWLLSAKHTFLISHWGSLKVLKKWTRCMESWLLHVIKFILIHILFDLF